VGQQRDAVPHVNLARAGEPPAGEAGPLAAAGAGGAGAGAGAGGAGAAGGGAGGTGGLGRGAQGMQEALGAAVLSLARREVSDFRSNVNEGEGSDFYGELLSVMESPAAPARAQWCAPRAALPGTLGLRSAAIAPAPPPPLT
jgi:hypothetical protein